MNRPIRSRRSRSRSLIAFLVRSSTASGGTKAFEPLTWTPTTWSGTVRATAGEVADLVAAHVQAQIQSVTGVVRVHAPAAAVAPWIEPAWGRFVAESPTTTIVEGGADTYAPMARWLSLVDAEITVLEPDELRHAFAELAKRAARAAQSGPGEPAPSGAKRLQCGSKSQV